MTPWRPPHDRPAPGARRPLRPPRGQRRGAGLRLLLGEDLLRAGPAHRTARWSMSSRCWTRPGRSRSRAPMLVPQAIKRTSGVASNFLWDKTSYALGRERRRKVSATCRSTQPSRRCTRDCWPGPMTRACRRCSPFSTAGRPSASRPRLSLPTCWTPTSSSGSTATWLPARAPGGARHLAALGWAAPTRPQAMCLVTGRDRPDRAAASGDQGRHGRAEFRRLARLLQPRAFTSYGKEQGANAPVSEAAAFGYGTASTRCSPGAAATRVRIGDATVVFWAETRGGRGRRARLLRPAGAR